MSGDKTPELLPCPLCGEAARETWPDSATDWVAECDGHDCGMEVHGRTEAEAVARWNRRSTLPPAAAGGGWRIPEGWQLVPIEPTEHQYEAGKVFVECCLEAVGKIDLKLTYQTMLQAAPHPDTEDGR